MLLKNILPFSFNVSVSLLYYSWQLDFQHITRHYYNKYRYYSYIRVHDIPSALWDITWPI